MSKKFKIIFWLLITIGVCTLIYFTVGTTFNNFKEAFISNSADKEDTLVIGVLEPQSGKNSKDGDLESMGIEIAKSIKPEILGQKVELVYADTQSDIYVTESAVQDLLMKKPTAILGPYGDACALTAGSYIAESKTPTITITATNPLITSNNDYYFRTSFTESIQGSAIAEYGVKKLKCKTAAVITTKDDDTTDEMARKFKAKFRNLNNDGEAIVYEEAIPLEETDYTSYLEEIKKTETRLVFLPVSITVAEKIFEKADELKMTNVTFIGPKEWHNDELISLQETYKGIKIAVASEFNANTEINNTELYDKFIAVYQKKYGKDAIPEDSTALGFDAYMLVAGAIEKANSLDGEAIKDALLTTENYKGASGSISFNSNGDPSKSINIDVIKDGAYVSVYTVK